MNHLRSSDPELVLEVHWLVKEAVCCSRGILSVRVVLNAALHSLVLYVGLIQRPHVVECSRKAGPKVVDLHAELQ